MKSILSSVKLWLAVTAMLSLVLLQACSSSSSTPTASATGPAVSVDLTAQNFTFDKTTITVPAGAAVTINFNNKDTGIQHNFAVYQTGSASGTATGVIFAGKLVTGPGTATYTFTAPATKGTYFFRCDVHPTQMTGSFIVQ